MKKKLLAQLLNALLVVGLVAGPASADTTCTTTVCDQIKQLAAEVMGVIEDGPVSCDGAYCGTAYDTIQQLVDTATGLVDSKLNWATQLANERIDWAVALVNQDLLTIQQNTDTYTTYAVILEGSIQEHPGEVNYVPQPPCPSTGCGPAGLPFYMVESYDFCLCSPGQGSFYVDGSAEARLVMPHDIDCHEVTADMSNTSDVQLRAYGTGYTITNVTTAPAFQDSATDRDNESNPCNDLDTAASTAPSDGGFNRAEGFGQFTGAADDIEINHCTDSGCSRYYAVPPSSRITYVCHWEMNAFTSPNDAEARTCRLQEDDPL